MSKLVKRKYRLEFDGEGESTYLDIIDKRTGKVVLHSPEVNGLYPVLRLQGKLPTAKMAKEIKLAHVWHERLGNVGKERLISASVASIGLPKIQKRHLTEHECVPCLESASKQAPVYSLEHIAQDPLDFIYTDITGSIKPPTLANNKYVAVFLDDSTRMGAV